MVSIDGIEKDGFGPERILEVYNPKVGMHGILVIDNTALGPGKGGIRMTPTVDRIEVFKLARTMTWKNALAEIPFGGAKSGIVLDPRTVSFEKKQEIVAAFAKAIKHLVPDAYIAGPDINMTEVEMETFVHANGSLISATGKPSAMGGLPHELGSTGKGVFVAADVAWKDAGRDWKGTTVAIEGFGNVGTFVMKFMTEAGAKVIAVSDSRGVAFDSKGLSFDALMKAKKEKGSVTAAPGVQVLPSSDIVGTDAEVLVTAAVPDLIKPNDIDRIKAKLIVEGSNIPMTAQTELLLAQKGVVVIPDFLANAGGVISSYAETIHLKPDAMFKMVEEKIRKNTTHVLERAQKHQHPYLRRVAQAIARERVLAKCDFCHVVPAMHDEGGHF